MVKKITFKNQKGKNSLVKPFLGLTFCLTFFTANAQTYCEPVLDCTDRDVILNVTFETLTNPSSCGSNGYSDFTSLTPPVLSKDSSYPISVTVGNGWTHESVSVWIDYNNNGIFEDWEFTYIGTGSANTVRGEITIPSTISTGNKRMRIRVAAVGADNATDDMACDTDQEYGETEDYMVTIQESLGITDNNFQKPIALISNKQLTINHNETIDNIELYDITGKLVYKKLNINNNSCIIDVSAASNQILILKTTTTDNNKHTQKVSL